jgi:diguanylate cyclase (GGDEF)-like protein
MQAPLIPANEHARLERLCSLNILDTPSDERFDRITRLAQRLFGVPIALVSLIDRNRQWFKSAQGLNARETSREISFCGHALLQEFPLLVPDALKDQRFFDNPLVTGEPHIRFYVGCPLRVSDGVKLGTLCLIDRVPRTFSAEDLSLLRDLADMIEQEIAAIELATIDELTKLCNRRGILTHGSHELDLCKRLDVPATALFFDLNRFKQINDQFGHAEGDHALKSFANLLTQSFRSCDIVARLSGDEFFVLAIDCDAANGQKLIDKLQRAVSDYNHGSAAGYDIDFSVGALSYDAIKHTHIKDLIADADTLMYQRKRLRSHHA